MLKIWAFLIIINAENIFSKFSKHIVKSNTLIQQGCISLLKVTVKTFIMLQKISNMLFFWTSYSSKNPEKNKFPQKYKASKMVSKMDNNKSH